MIKPKMYLVIDTETASVTGEVYDIGWVICKKDGVPIAEKTFLVQEVLRNPQLMMGAYFAKKIFSDYIPAIEAGEVQSLPWIEVAEEFRKDFEKHDVSVVCAYNLPFDMRALRKMVRHYGDSPLVSKPVDLLCLWEACCQLRLNSFGYKAFASKHGLVTRRGNFQTNAECAYRYMTMNPEFMESHTALHDALIEAQLLAWCLKRKKKMPYNILGGQPWRLLKSV